MHLYVFHPFCVKTQRWFMQSPWFFSESSIYVHFSLIIFIIHVSKKTSLKDSWKRIFYYSKCKFLLSHIHYNGQCFGFIAYQSTKTAGQTRSNFRYIVLEYCRICKAIYKEVVVGVFAQDIEVGDVLNYVGSIGWGLACNKDMGVSN